LAKQFVGIALSKFGDFLWELVGG